MPSQAQVLAVDRVPDRAAKRCANCRREKALDEFSPSPRAKDGLRSWCRRCERIAAHERYHEQGGREKAAAYHDRPEVEARDRKYRAEHAGLYHARQTEYRNTPRGKLISSRGNARSKLRRATTDRERARLETRIALYDREIARLDREHELPAEPPRPRVAYGSRSPWRGVYLTKDGTYQVKVPIGHGEVCRGGTFATEAEARDAANALAFRVLGVRDYAIEREPAKKRRPA